MLCFNALVVSILRYEIDVLDSWLLIVSQVDSAKGLDEFAEYQRALLKDRDDLSIDHSALITVWVVLLPTS